MLTGFEPAPTILGTLLVLFTLHDLVSTTVSVSSGAGPLTHRLGAGVWGVARWTARRTGATGVLRRAGPIVLFAIIGLWTLLLILGWSLVFGQPETIVSVEGGEPVAFLGNVYFASSLVTGMGSPSVATSTNAWQIVEQLAAASGVMLLGLSIAYVVPVVQAVVAKRQVAAYIHTLGDDANEILRRAWNGRDLGDLDLHVIALTGQIAGLAERHLAYPVVHYFFSSERRTAIGPAIAAIDGVLTLNAHVLGPAVRLDDSVTLPLERAVGDFLRIVSPRGPEDAAVEPTWPSFDDLADAGIPLVEGVDSLPMPAGIRERQAAVLAYLDHDGWGSRPVRQAAA